MIKKILAFLISSIMAIVCISFNANAKVIEPEVVKTEKWTTSYYIDDDIDTLYPYIQCEADIYNDGAIKLYMWNTHEWDGFATVSHTATIIQTSPETQNSMVYYFHNGVPYTDDYGRTFFPCIGNDATTNYSEYKDIDVSYYSDKYSCIERRFWNTRYKSLHYYLNSESYVRDRSISYSRYDDALPKMSFATARNSSYVWMFIPKEDPTGTYNFRLFGHDITITPELLSGNIVSEPILTEQEQYIKQLEEENKKLKEQLNLLSGSSCGDIDGDGDISVEDAQLLLQYYTESKVARLTDKPIKDWYIEKYGSK